MSSFVEQNFPRYALESDTEEEFNPQRHNVQCKELKVKFVGSSVRPKSALIVANRRPGALWGKGADLREQIGAVLVNDVQIGLVYNPEWTDANVLVSEVLSKLPLRAMHVYAQAIIDALKPDRVAVLDEYSVSTYISDHRVSWPDAPIRYLSTTHFNPGTLAQAFTPPNVINTTSASFISILSLQTTCSGTLVLLPCRRIGKPAPQIIESATLDHSEHGHTWPVEMMAQADNLLVHAIGESQSRTWRRVADSELGEGEMYIS